MIYIERTVGTGGCQWKNVQVQFILERWSIAVTEVKYHAVWRLEFSNCVTSMRSMNSLPRRKGFALCLRSPLDIKTREITTASSRTNRIPLQPIHRPKFKAPSARLQDLSNFMFMEVSEYQKTIRAVQRNGNGFETEMLMSSVCTFLQPIARCALP